MRRGGGLHGASVGGKVVMIARRVSGGGAISRAGAPIVLWSVVRKVVPSKDVSLEHILIRKSTERCGFFRAWEMSYGDLPRR